MKKVILSLRGLLSLHVSSNFTPFMRAQNNKAPQLRGFVVGVEADYLILVSLYSTCLRAFGSNFMIDIFSGMVRLFFVVV